MIAAIDVFDTVQCAKLLALQRAAYQVEADLITFADLPPLKDTTASLQASGETFWGYVVTSDLAGAISFKMIAATLDIHRLMVHPRYFRRGIASALLRFVHEHALAGGRHASHRLHRRRKYPGMHAVSRLWIPRHIRRRDRARPHHHPLRAVPLIPAV